jgi:hypothetical protein
MTEARRQQLAQIAPQGGRAAAKVHKAAAKARWSREVAACATKADVWPLAYRAGYKAAQSAAYRRGYADGYERAVRALERAS